MSEFLVYQAPEWINEHPAVEMVAASEIIAPAILGLLLKQAYRGTG